LKGNVDLRVPYMATPLNPNRIRSAGISAYKRLQAHVEKRMITASNGSFLYLLHGPTDEQSALGLFYNGTILEFALGLCAV